MNKKLAIGVIAIALMVSPATIFAKGNAVNGKSNKQSQQQSGNKQKQQTKNQGTQSGKQSDSIKVKKEAMKQAVKSKADLAKLRQQLKNAAEANPELQMQYQALVELLEEQNNLGEAVETQKELLQRFYQKGDRQQFEKLGKLLKKQGKPGIKAFVDGEEVSFDVSAFKQGGRAMVPIRAISAALKADVQWQEETRSVTITKGETTITLFLDKPEALVNGEAVALDTNPVVKNGRLFLPFRFVGEQLNANVDYQPDGDIIIIEDPTDGTVEQPQQPTEETPEQPAGETPQQPTDDETNTPEQTDGNEANTPEGSTEVGQTSTNNL